MKGLLRWRLHIRAVHPQFGVTPGPLQVAVKFCIEMTVRGREGGGKGGVYGHSILLFIFSVCVCVFFCLSLPCLCCFVPLSYVESAKCF